jgi:hypothetical protein
VELREREAKGWVINFFFFFEGVEINSKGKREIRGSFFGVALERESFIVSKGMVWGICFSKGVVR